MNESSIENDIKKTVLDKKALLIINPVSGKKAIIRQTPQIIRCFMDSGYMVTTMVTSYRGEATEFTEKYAAGYDLICCTGGDGPLNETINGLANKNIRMPLGYIPCGSTNDFANSHSLSTDILTAARNIATGKVREYDVGVFGDEYFTYVAAFGAFSWLSYTTDQNLKNVLGHTAYILDGIKDVSKIKPIHLKMNADGTEHEGNYIFGAVCNSTSIAGTIALPKHLVDTSDGVFEVLLIRMPANIQELENILRSLISQDYTSPFIDFFQARDIYIENPDGLDWSLDGECSGLYKSVHVYSKDRFMLLKS